MKSAGKFKSDEVQSIIYEKMPALTNTVEQTMIKNGVDALIYPTMSCVASVRHDAKDSTYKCDSDDPYAASYLASSAHLPEISVPSGRDSQNMPIGLSFTGAQDSERILLGLAAAYEKIIRTRTATFWSSTDLKERSGFASPLEQTHFRYSH